MQVMSDLKKRYVSLDFCSVVILSLIYLRLFFIGLMAHLL